MTVDDTDARGVRIGNVTSESAADKAGLKVGDVVAEIEGQPVADWGILQSLIKSARPGQAIKLKVFRGDKELTLSATLDEMPPQTRNYPYKQLLMSEYGLILRDSDNGVRVRPMDGTPAADAGFERRQTLSAIADQPVKDSDDAVTKLIERGFFSGKAVKVTVVTTTDQTPTKQEIEMRMRK
jgi:S1-C subfamily serine protease